MAGSQGCYWLFLSEMQVADEHPSFVNPLNGNLQFPCPPSLPVPCTLLLHNESSMFGWFTWELSTDRPRQLQLSSQDQSCS